MYKKSYKYSGKPYTDSVINKTDTIGTIRMVDINLSR